jgi:predicted aspartyl protease
MEISLRDGLPFVSVTVAYASGSLTIPDVVLDTGSAHTVLSADILGPLGIVPQPDDVLYAVRGIGGVEVVFARKLDSLGVGSAAVPGLEVEVGGVDYGFGLNGILGMDFLRASGAVIDLGQLTIAFPSRGEYTRD